MFPYTSSIHQDITIQKNEKEQTEWYRTIIKKPKTTSAGLPGYSNYNKEAKEILVSSKEGNEGFSAVYQRLAAVGERFSYSVTHSTSVGSTSQPPEYMFNTALRTVSASLQTQTTSNNLWFGSFKFSPFRELKSEVAYVFQPNPMDPSGGSSSLKVNKRFKGKDYKIGTRLDIGNSYGISYVQRITNALSMGVQTSHSVQEAKSSIGTVVRYEMQPQRVLAAEIRWEDAEKGKFPLETQVKISYVDRILPGLSYAAELTMFPQTREVKCQYGFAHQFIGGHELKVTGDQQANIKLAYQHKLSMTSDCSASIVAKPKSQDYKFGVQFRFLE